MYSSTKSKTVYLYPIWLIWSVSKSIFQSKQRKRGGDPCKEKCVMMSFSLVIDFHFLYSSSTFFFKLKRLSWGTLFCLKKACKKKLCYVTAVSLIYKIHNINHSHIILCRNFNISIQFKCFSLPNQRVAGFTSTVYTRV